MSELDNLSIRLKYMGGVKAESRLQTDKLRTLKKALLYSYQAATAVLHDGREFRCLINPDKLKNDYDNKIISIPFKDICLNSEFLGIPTSYAEEPTNMQVGDVFQWKETETYWMVYLRYLEEDAYFRAEIRKCDNIITINGKDYRSYVRGPVETTIKWNQKKGINWNIINYSAVAYVPADENTSQLKRFSIVKLNGQNYEVQVVNRITSGGIIILYLSEYYSNSIEEEMKQNEEKKESEESISGIVGATEVHPFDIVLYNVEDDDSGSWSVNSDKVRIIATGPGTATIEVVTGKAGAFEITYQKQDGTIYTLPVEIESF